MALIQKELIFLNLEVKHKDDLLQVLTDELLKQRKIIKFDDVYEAFWEREGIISTGIGKRVAIPHAKSGSVLEPSLLFARLKKPILFQSLDGEPVDLIFMIAMPEASEQTHLRVLSQVATKLLDENTKDVFRKSETVDDVYRILMDIQKEVFA